MLLEVLRLSLFFRRYHGLVQQRSYPVLHDLDFRLERGAVLAVVGASGAGKSLLAHALVGVLPPNAHRQGRMLLDGTDLGPETLPNLRGRKIGLVPQSLTALDPLVSCGRQLLWAAQRSGTRLSRIEMNALLARHGLDPDLAKAFPHRLSGGMARRLLLAMATVGGPDLIIADEPTSGLDQANAQRTLRYLRQLAEEGRGVLLITHDLAQALPFADQVAVLDKGRLVGIEKAIAFTGNGKGLVSSHAQALWRALPQNSFIKTPAEHA